MQFFEKLNVFSRDKKLSKISAKGLHPAAKAAALTVLQGGLRGGFSDVIENRRSEIAEIYGENTIEVLYSPKPQNELNATGGGARPIPGAKLNFTMERIANTGKNKVWGGAIHAMAEELKAESIIELGSCVGISGAYLSSTASCRQFHTIEGSPRLAALASETLRKINKNAHVHTGLFDEVLDYLLPEIGDLDFVFIDGHHEKLATIHYWDRIKDNVRPGGMVVFDDISWSCDMRDGWEVLCRKPEFSDAIDFGPIGACLVGGGSGDLPRYWDLQTVLGRTRIGTPHGWRREAGETVR